MENHPIPRSVTSFEFKLIGWFTVKEFIYLLIAAGIAVIVYFVIPIPYLNIFMSALVVGAGAVMVFYKYNDRPLDSWIKNLTYRLLKPSQFIWHKNNPAPDFLSDVMVTTDAIIVGKHLDASQKLQSYIETTSQQEAPSSSPSQQETQAVTTLLHDTAEPASTSTISPEPSQTEELASVSTQTTPQKEHPYLSGIVSSNKEIPLPNIMVYLNSNSGELVRILKTNRYGVFASFHPLPGGTYVLSPKDLGGKYFFDTMTVAVNGPQKEPVRIFSKELL